MPEMKNDDLNDKKSVDSEGNVSAHDGFLSTDFNKNAFDLERHPIDQMTAGRHLTFYKNIMFDNPVSYCRYSNNDKFLAVGLMNGKIALIQNDIMNIDCMLDSGIEGLPCTSIRWRPNDRLNEMLLTTNCDGSLTGFSLRSKKVKWKIQEKSSNFLCADYKNAGNGFIVGDHKGNISIYDEETTQVVRCYERGHSNSPGHTNRVFSIKCFDDKNPCVFLSGGWDSIVYFWDMRDSKVSPFLIKI